MGRERQRTQVLSAGSENVRPNPQNATSSLAPITKLLDCCLSHQNAPRLIFPVPLLYVSPQTLESLRVNVPSFRQSLKSLWCARYHRHRGTDAVPGAGRSSRENFCYVNGAAGCAHCPASPSTQPLPGCILCASVSTSVSRDNNSIPLRVREFILGTMRDTW